MDNSNINDLSGRVIGLAIEVRKILGPGLLESAYEECFCYELSNAGIGFERQKSLPVVYKGVRHDCGYRIDLVVDSKIIVEIKSVDKVLPVHQAQLMTYLRLLNVKLGIILNFNVPALKDGIKRIVL